jgi:two-component sensor histidine kinase
MKHAFNDRSNGLITVSLARNGDCAVLLIRDNGCGIPAAIDFGNTSGFGFMLVNLLTQQLSGVIRINRKDGTEIVMEFKL